MRCRFGVLVLIVLAGMMIFSQGCASIWGQSKQKVRVTSRPDNAAITIHNRKGEVVYQGTTPATIRLRAGAGYFLGEEYTVKFKKAGCRECTAQIDRGINIWYAVGNFFFGSWIGYLVVDPLTGAMWSLKDLHMDLEDQPAAQTTGDTLRILAIDQVPKGARARMVRIN